MRKTLLVVFVGAALMFGVSAPDKALAKKGGVGKGGGYSENGVLYHSHSDRSYSGKSYVKAKAVGPSKTIKGKGKAKGHYKKAPLQ